MRKPLSKHTKIALLIMLTGAALRLYHLFFVPLNQPFRLGGLFYEFSRQILINEFILPQQIPYYSAGGIPYAYPPLGFYVQAIFLRLFDPPLFFTVNLLPPLITTLSLPAFYWMIQQFSEDTSLTLWGLLAFACLPTAFINQIEAAGLAECFGLLALLLYLGLLFRWKKSPNLRDSLLAGIALGGCVLSSPGSAYAATLFSILLFLWISFQQIKHRALQPIMLLILVGITGIVISAPYWLTVMQNHGIDLFITPFLRQHQTSNDSLRQISDIFSFQPAGLYLSFIWNWLILAGVFWATLHRQGLILTLFGSFWLIPREGIWLVAIPAAILAGMGILYTLHPMLKKAFHKKIQNRLPLAPGILATLLVLGVFANTFITLHVVIADQEWHLSQAQVESLETLRPYIPIEARVITLGNTALAEWAPTILQRETLNIEYGLEWQPDELAKVETINSALEESDLTTLLAAIDDYTGDTQIYLVAKAESSDILEQEPPSEADLSMITTTPALSLYLLKVNQPD